MHRIMKWAFGGMLVATMGAESVARAQGPSIRSAEPSPAQSALNRASEAGKFSFIVFYKDDTPAVRAMVEVVKNGVATREAKAVAVYVQATNPAEKELVERYEVSRSPMPLTLTIAPNGAVTGVFSKVIADDKFDEAIVTPTMTRCMKSLQDNRMVFVCVQTSEKEVVPVAVKEIQSSPEFKNRVTVISMQLLDADETRFLKQMQIDPRTTTGMTAVLLAPPGVLIGKFDSLATSTQIAAALQKAGKCCDDPNCKHGHAPAQQANQPAKSLRR